MPNTKKSAGSISKPKRKPQNKLEKNKLNMKSNTVQNLVAEDSLVSKHLAGHMTPEEVERHLESRRLIHNILNLFFLIIKGFLYIYRAQQLEFSFAPDKAPATVPTEMFSNDLDGMSLKLFIHNVTDCNINITVLLGVGCYTEFLEEMETSPSNGGDEHLGVEMDHN